MASFRFHGNTWQARIRRKGYPEITDSFLTKLDAERWARSVESEMDKGHFADCIKSQQTTLKEIILRYVQEVTPTMKSAKEDAIRLRAIARKPISSWSLTKISSSRIAEYRDLRLNEVSAGTVNRELAYLSSIINHARREWGITIQNPVQQVRKPTSPPGRTRTLSEDEEKKLLVSLEPLGRRSPWTYPIVMLALETAMRRSELLALLWENIDLKRQTAFLPDTKNGSSRKVPLTLAAVGVLSKLPRNISGVVFPVKYFTLDAAFKRAVKRAGLIDFRFHDLRHTAISKMAEKLPNLIELSAVTGHKSLSMLKRYYHPDAEALAKKLG